MFIFGGDTGQTYEQVQRKRRIADAMMQPGATPQNVGEGISSFARQISGALIGRRAAKRDAELREASNERFQSLFGGGSQPATPAFSAAPSAAPVSTGGPMTPEQQVGADTRAALGFDPASFDFSPYAVGGAAAREDSFSGLRPEFASGVAQMVQDAHAAGIPLQITSAYRSPELQQRLFDEAVAKYGSEDAARRWVAPAGRSQHNFGTAVDFAVNGSLIRDANSPEAQWIRENAENYGLSVPMDWEPWQVELAGARSGGAAQAPMPSRGGGQSPQMGQIVAALSDPYIQQDPGKMMVLQSLLQQAMPQQSTPTSAMQNYEFLVQQGVDPQAAIDRAFSGGGITVENNMGPQGQQWPDPPSDMVYLRNPDGSILTEPDPSGRGVRPVAVPIVGSDPDIDAAAAQAAEEEKGAAAETASTVIENAFSRAHEADSQRVLRGTFGKLAAVLPETQNAEVVRQVSVLQDLAAAESLNAMRRQSPTGGALGNVTERELALLSRQAGALDPASPNFQRDLRDYTLALMRTVHGGDEGERIANELFASMQTDQAPAPAETAPPPAAPAEVPDFTAMSDEELAAWIAENGG